MQHTLKLLAFTAALAGSAVALAGGPLQTFTAQSLQHIEAQHEGKAFLLVLWSVHCAPCYAELAHLAEALQAEPALPVVLVSTDAPHQRAEVEDTLHRYGLTTHAGWQFADDMPEKLRFHIDPAWYGELPRSYFYNATQQRQGYSGALTREQVQDWTLQRGSSPQSGVENQVSGN